MKHMDDNTLAAYLEGTLPEEDREWVEQAIEDDDELKAVVDEWISMADAFCVEKMMEDNSELRMEACRNIKAVMEQIDGSPNSLQKASGANYCDIPRHAEMSTMAEKQTRPFKQKWPMYRKIIVAASLLAFVSVTGIWLLNSPSDDLVTAPSFDVPMGGYPSYQPGVDSSCADFNMQYYDYIDSSK